MQPNVRPVAGLTPFFAAAALDPESASAVQALGPIGWVPHNAILQPGGTVETL